MRRARARILSGCNSTMSVWARRTYALLRVWCRGDFGDAPWTLVDTLVALLLRHDENCVRGFDPRTRKILVLKDAPQKPHLGKILWYCRTNFPILKKSLPEPIQELQRSDSSNLACISCSTYAICSYQLGSSKFDLQLIECDPIFEVLGFHAIDQR